MSLSSSNTICHRSPQIDVNRIFYPSTYLWRSLKIGLDRSFAYLTIIDTACTQWQAQYDLNWSANSEIIIGAESSRSAEMFVKNREFQTVSARLYWEKEEDGETYITIVNDGCKFLYSQLFAGDIIIRGSSTDKSEYNGRQQLWHAITRGREWRNKSERQNQMWRENNVEQWDMMWR